MSDSTLIDALLGSRPVPISENEDSKPARLLQEIVVGRLTQCFPDLRRLVQNQYELDLRGKGGPLMQIRMRIAANPRHYFWNNAGETFIQKEIVRASSTDSKPVILACLLPLELDRILVWQIDLNELLAARHAARVPTDAESYGIERQSEEGPWRLRYQGNILLDIDVNGTHAAIPLGQEERSRLDELLQIREAMKLVIAAESTESNSAEETAAAALPPAEEAEEPVEIGDKILERMLDTLSVRGQIILQGPPGTGKTHYALQFIDLCCGCRGQPDATRRELRDRARFTPGLLRAFPKGLEGRETAWSLVQFHPSYGYEDFVRGVVAEPGQHGQPVFRAKDKLFASLCAWAAEQVDRRRVILVIDEINRADVARVFGELVMGLEADKRGEAIATPYSVDRPGGVPDSTLVIPKNLWIVGTMNAADRSVVRFDMALRRRFSFIDILAGPTALESYYAALRERKDPDWPEKIQRLDEAISLYKTVLRMFQRRDGTWNSQGRDHALGPSFFMVPYPVDQKNFRFLRSLRDCIDLEVLPQLLEYSVEGVPIEEDGRREFARQLQALGVFLPSTDEGKEFYAKYGDFLGVSSEASAATTEHAT